MKERIEHRLIAETRREEPAGVYRPMSFSSLRVLLCQLEDATPQGVDYYIELARPGHVEVVWYEEQDAQIRPG